MTATAYFRYIKVLQGLYDGPLGAHIDLYATRLIQEGHCYQSGARCLRVVGDFNRWLAHEHMQLSDIDEHVVEQYQQFRKRYRHPFITDRPALYRLLAVLREVDIIAPPTPIPPDPLTQIKQDFAHYLSQECGLARASIIRHHTPLRKFLQECCSGGSQVSQYFPGQILLAS